MTDELFRQDPYLRHADAHVVAHTPEGGVVLDCSVFYPTGGGQPGDSGRLTWGSHALNVATTVRTDGQGIALVPADASALPPLGTPVQQELDWGRRYRLMRMHTALHLLSVVIPLPVTGGAISADKGRLDFDMPDAPEDKEALTAALNELIEQDFQVSESWISDEDLVANPGLIKTMSVKLNHPGFTGE